jgi:hypothetical protein
MRGTTFHQNSADFPAAVVLVRGGARSPRAHPTDALQPRADRVDARSPGDA